MATSAPFASSLRAALGASSASTTGPSHTVSGAFGNPFASLPAGSVASVAAPTSAVEARKVVMSAFSELDLALDESLAGGGSRSAARDLLAKKREDREAEQRAGAARLQAKTQQQQQQSARALRPQTALDQALDAFDGEAEAFRSQGKGATGGGLSRRARQKKDRAKEKAESYDGRRGSGRTRGGVLRRNKYKKV